MRKRGYDLPAWALSGLMGTPPWCAFHSTKGTLMRKAIATTTGLAIALSVGAGIAYIAPTSDLPACEFEDSTNCVWNADSQGNGQGRSFINLNGTIHYLD